MKERRRERAQEVLEEHEAAKAASPAVRAADLVLPPQAKPKPRPTA